MSCHVCLVVCLPGYDGESKLAIMKSFLFLLFSFFFSFQEYSSNGTAHVESEYERRMMSVFNHVLEEVESLNRKYAPVSYLASNSFKCILSRERGQNPRIPYNCGWQETGKHSQLINITDSNGLYSDSLV